MPLKTGQILNNRYRIVKLLGQGGFGAVYRAWDVNLSRPCAVKENMDASPEAQVQFGREATILANLIHPNLARVTDYFFLPGQGQYLVMDYVEGEDLQGMLERTRASIPEPQALDWIGQVCDALNYMHAQNPPIIHRDIKPANIKITPEGKAVLVDFGIAKLYDPNLKTTLGARAVTPGYSSPEQYGQGKTDPRSDIYSLGATLYTLVTGQTPPESVEILMRDSGPVTPAVQINPHISASVSAAIAKAMDTDRTRRFTSGQAFKSALMDRASSPAPVPSTVYSPSVQPVQPSQPATPAAVWQSASSPAGAARPASASPPRRIPWVWIGGIGIIGFLGLCMILFLSSRGGGGNTPSPTFRPTRTPSDNNSSASTQIHPTAAATLPPSTPLPMFVSSNPQTYTDVVAYDPDTLDPALSYSLDSNPIPNNVYETLVTYKRDDPNAIIPLLATGWGVSGDGLTYTFKLHQGIKFHDGSPLTAMDVAYSFQRGLLQGGTSSPQWLLTEPIFGQDIYDIAELVDSSGKLDDNPVDLANANADLLVEACQRVLDAITPVDDNTVAFHLNQPYAPFLATLAGPWGSIQSRQWIISNGGWDGDCAHWQNYYGKTAEDLNKTPLGSAAMGTGPYLLDHWKVGSEIELTANPDYWRQEPAWPGGPVGAPALQSVVVKIVSDAAQRLAMFQSGEADSVNAYTVDFADLDKQLGLVCMPDGHCQPSASPEKPGMLLKASSNNYHNDLFFTWNINTQEGNPLIGSGQLDGNGIPPDFFNDIHIRKAFAYCFNYEDYLNRAFNGEAIRTTNIMLPGMVGYNPQNPIYNYDPGKCADEFNASGWKAPDGRSLWDVGFTITIPYNSGNLQRQAVAEIYQRELAAVNPKFKVLSSELENTDFQQYRTSDKLPVFISGWIEDYQDTHNWVVPYTSRTPASRQNMSQDQIEVFKNLALQGASEMDPAKRADIYRELSQVYFEQAPATLLFTQWTRHYQQRWVEGWYPNPVLPGTYYYVLKKN
jgi:peptide/nickel transport system substrate-binding protein